LIVAVVIAVIKSTVSKSLLSATHTRARASPPFALARFQADAVGFGIIETPLAMAPAAGDAEGEGEIPLAIAPACPVGAGDADAERLETNELAWLAGTVVVLANELAPLEPMEPMEELLLEPWS